MATGKGQRGRRARTRSNGTGFLSSIFRGSSTNTLRSSSVSGSQRSLLFESLEDRRMLATYVVNNLSDVVNGNVVTGSLRQAIQVANGNGDGNTFDTIVFEDFLFEDGPQAIILNGGQITISAPLDILGPSGNLLTIQAGGGNNRIFLINDGNDMQRDPVEIAGVTLTGGSIVGDGDDQRGGAIRNNENLTLTEVVVTGNSASQGGGGIFNTSNSSLFVNRSLFENNSTGASGGGIMNGGGDDGANTTINNSTFFNNRAGLHGGGIFNRVGVVTISQSTITGNDIISDDGYGGGISTYGVDPEEENPPVIRTTVDGSIITNNDRTDTMGVITFDDFSGVTVNAEGDPITPDPVSAGFNIYSGDPGGVFGMNDTQYDDDAQGVPLLLPLDDYGGAIPVFLPDTSVAMNPAIDGGDPTRTPLLPPEPPFTEFGGRGRHFTRFFDGNDDMLPQIDIGAAEVQVGNWLVDALIDESDGQYSTVWDEDPTALPGFNEVIVGYDVAGTISRRGGDFTLREAIEFAIKNPEEDLLVGGEPAVDRISFSSELVEIAAIDDPNPFSIAPTIDLDFGEELPVSVPVIIEGPTNFELEVDATNSDPTPSINNGDGIRVFNVDDGDDLVDIEVTISGLTIMGGDIGSSGAVGGGILNHEILTLSNSTVKENSAVFTGGGIHAADGTLTIVDSAVVTNVASSNGAGLFVDDGSGTVLVSNSTFSGNLAGARGGGIYNEGADTTVQFTTITENNSAGLQGSGVQNSSSGVIRFFSTIISGNINNDIDQFTGGTITSWGFNFVGDGAANTNFSAATNDILNTNPQLDPLAVKGGLTPTHEPMDNSPVIDVLDPIADAGDIPVEVTIPDFDQRGGPFFQRIDNGKIDIGSYELQDQNNDLMVDNPGDQIDGLFGPGELTLREAIFLSNTLPGEQTIGVSVPFIFITGSGLPGDNDDIVISEDVTIDFGGVLIQSLTDMRIFTIDDGDDGSEIDVNFSNLSIRDSMSSGDRGFAVIRSASDGLGGAIYNSENLSISASTFINIGTLDPELEPGDPGYVANARFDGGVIYHRLGSLDIVGTTFSGNETDGEDADGGAIYSVDGDVTIDESLLLGNSTLKAFSDGGGIHFRDGTLAITNSVFAGNALVGGNSKGGGIYTYAGAGETATVMVTGEQSLISGNTAAEALSVGAGIYNYQSDVTIQDVTISANTSFGSFAGGVGIYQSGGSLNVEGTLMTQNSALGISSHGAAIAGVGGAVVTITASHLTDNRATGNDSFGAGVYNSNGTLTVRDSALDRNSTTGENTYGGAIYSSTSAFEQQFDLEGNEIKPTDLTTIVNSTISGNTAVYAGGGVFNAGGLTEIFNSTITLNRVDNAGFGDGVGSFGVGETQPQPGTVLIDTQTRVKDSIIAENVSLRTLSSDFNSDGRTDGLDFLIWQQNVGRTDASQAEGDANGDMIVDSADLEIFEEEYASRSVPSDVDRVDGSFDQTFVSLGFNVIGLGTSSVVFDTSDSNYTGPGGDQSGIIDPGLEVLDFINSTLVPVHALQAGSPAIDAGDPDFDPTDFNPPLDLDQDGNVRVANGTIDVGSYEFDSAPPLVILAEQASPSTSQLTVDEVDGDPLQTVGLGSEVSSITVAEDETLVVDVETNPAATNVEIKTEVATIVATNVDDQLSASSSAANRLGRGSVILSSLANPDPEIVWGDRPEREAKQAAFETLAPMFHQDVRSAISQPRRFEFELPGDSDGEVSDQYQAEDSVFDELGEVLV